MHRALFEMVAWVGARNPNTHQWSIAEQGSRVGSIFYGGNALPTKIFMRISKYTFAAAMFLAGDATVSI